MEVEYNVPVDDEKEFLAYLSREKERLLFQRNGAAGRALISDPELNSTANAYFDSLLSCFYHSSANVRMKSALVNFLQECIKAFPDISEFWWAKIKSVALFSLRSAIDQHPTPVSLIKSWLGFLVGCGEVICRGILRQQDQKSPLDELIAMLDILCKSLHKLSRLEYLKLEIIKTIHFFIMLLSSDEFSLSPKREFLMASQTLTEQFLQFVIQSTCSYSVATAAFSLLVTMVKNRSVSLAPVVMPFLLGLPDGVPPHFSPSQRKSFLKALKVQLKILCRLNSLRNYRDLAEETFNSLLNQAFEEEESSVHASSQSLDLSSAVTSRAKAAISLSDLEYRKHVIDRCFPRHLGVSLLPLDALVKLVEASLGSLSEQDMQTSLIKLDSSIASAMKSEFEGKSVVKTRMKRDPRKRSTFLPSKPADVSNLQSEVEVKLKMLFKALNVPVGRFVPQDTTKKDTRGEDLAITSRTFEEPFELKSSLELRQYESLEMILMAFMRVFDQEIPMSYTYKARGLWITSIIRMFRCIVNLSNVIGDYNPLDKVCASICEYILEDFKTRCDFTIIWLNQLYLLDLKFAMESKERNLYRKWCLSLTRGITDRLELLKDKSISKFLLEVPHFMGNEFLTLIYSFCLEDNQKFQVALNTLRDLILQRPQVRNICVQLFCYLCFHKDGSKRTAAVIMVKKWLFDSDIILEQFEDFCVLQLNHINRDDPKEAAKKAFNFSNLVPDYKSYDLITPGVKEWDADEDDDDDDFGEDQEDESEKKKVRITLMDPDNILGVGGGVLDPGESKTKKIVWKAVHFHRYTELFVVLCMKHPRLLIHLLKLFSTIKDEDIYRIMTNQITAVTKSISIDSPDISFLLENFPAEAGEVILKLLALLVKNSENGVSDSFKKMVLQVIKERSLDFRFFLPIMKNLTKVEALNHLSSMFHVMGSENPSDGDKRITRDMVTKLIDPSISTSPFRPAEFLVMLHKTDALELLAAKSLINLCITDISNLFNSEVMSVVLQELVELEEFPKLFMWTIIRTHQLMPNMGEFISSNVLLRALSREIWRRSDLWIGFIKCCDRLFPASLDLVRQLSESQLRAFFDNISESRKTIWLDHMRKNRVQK